MNYYVLCYTRTPLESLVYSAKLAYSMHLAYSEDGKDFQALNHNSGVLFAKATENEDRSLNAKSLQKPYLFHLKDGSFGVVAVRTEADGSADEQSKGKVLFFTSPDLLQYEEVGLIDLKFDRTVCDVACEYVEDEGVYLISWSDGKGGFYKNVLKDPSDLACTGQPLASEPVRWQRPAVEIEGAVPGNLLAISKEIGERLLKKLTVPRNVGMEVPKGVTLSCPDELAKVKAVAIYSDGTTAEKPVNWDTKNVDWSKPGKYEINGTVAQPHFPFPLIVDRADPCVIRWEGKYYFVSTNDADHNKTMYIRQADTLQALAQAEDMLILDTETYPDIKGLLWAPELHVIGDELYIMHAATPGKFFWQQARVMKLKKGGNPLLASDWSRPKTVVKKDGSPLCEAGKAISLDMTYFKLQGEHYVVWSERQFVPVDLGAWLYLAKISPEKPWQLTTDPVLLSKPEYGWANNNTFVDEGPFALIRDGKIYLTFSSALVDATYVVGLLTADVDADLLDAASWIKKNFPLLTSRSVEGEYGAGHNAYVVDEHGMIWNTYHARPGIEGPRSTGIRRVHFDVDGEPRLDLTEKRDVAADLANVTLELIIRRKPTHVDSV